MKLANLLTCSRAGLALLFAYCLFHFAPFGNLFALFLFVLASLTDYWDGHVARQMGEVSQFGKLMDPIADKMLTLAAFLSFWRLGLVPLWMVLAVVARDLLVTVVRFFMPLDSDSQSARASGKQKTVLQMLYIIAVLLFLIARLSPEWNPDWDLRSLLLVKAGMLLIVMITLVSGLRVLVKNTALFAGRRT